MIKLILIVILFSLSISAFEISQIINEEGNYKLKFDSNFNCYVTKDSGNFSFYKIDSEKNVVIRKDLGSPIDIAITSQDDVYIFGTESVDTIWLLKANETEPHPIFKYPSSGYFTGRGTFIDEEDNMLFNTLNGIMMLKPGKNIPIAVENLTGYYFYPLSTTVDQQGNIFLSRMLDRGLADIVVITSSAKHQPVPYAVEVEDLKDSGLKAYEIQTDSNGNVIFSVEMFDYSGKVKVLKNNLFTTILSQYQIHHYLLPQTKNRTFLMAADPVIEDLDKFTCNLYVINGNAEVERIDRIFDLTFWNKQTLFVGDKNDNMYFVNNYNEVLWVKNGETEIKELFKGNDTIARIIVDNSGVLWVIQDGKYFLVSLDSGDIAEYSDIPLGNVQVAKENEKTGEIYVASWQGLYVLRA